MKKQNQFEPHLVIKEFTVLPGGEWLPQSSVWLLLQIKSGNGYFMRTQNNLELPTGTILCFFNPNGGVIRASQLGKMIICAYEIHPARLTGLMNFGEYDLLKAIAARKDSALKTIPASQPLAAKMNELVTFSKNSGLVFRLKLLQIFVEAVGEDLENVSMPAAITDAKERLRQLFHETPPDQLVEMSFQELAQRVHCTSRHLSRIFQELTGMSFRDRRMEIRMARARELLANSQSKVVEVAFESGFKSLSLFNLIFSRSHGVSPGRWRRNHLSRGLFGKRPVKK